MNTPGENVDERAVGADAPVRRTRIATVTVATIALVVALLGVAAAPALAVAPAGNAEPADAAPANAAPALATSPSAAVDTGSDAPRLADATPTPTPTSTSTPVPQNQLTPAPGTPSTPPTSPPVRPTIADPGDITTGTVRFHGAATPGHAIDVDGPSSTGSTGCRTTTRADGSWSCLATVRSGPQQVFTARDRTAPALGSASTPASDVIVPPVVTTSRPTNGPVSGTGHAGSTITLSVSGSSADRTATVGRDGRWTVSLGGATASGDARLTVTATQTASTADGYRSDLESAASAPVTVTLDRTVPAAPRITSPAPGDRVSARSATVSGTGEPGAVVTVYLDRAPVCRTDVPTAGTWSCSTSGSTLRLGVGSVTASQQDAAGNFSRTSAAVRVVVTAAGTAPTGSSADPTGRQTGNGTATAGTGSPSGGPTNGAGVAPTGGGGGSGSGSASTPGSAGGSHPDAGSGPASSPGSGGAPDWSGPAGDWTASTAYDSTVPTIQTAFSWRTVLVATAVAAGFLVLVAGPLALVAGAARGRVRNPFAGLLGRNRPREERRRGEDALPTWASITVGVLVVALCTLLGVGVSLEARYVRLAIAVVIGAAVLTTTVVLASRWAAGSDRDAIRFRLSPWLVLAALVACALTRSSDLSPAVVVGAVLVPVGRSDVDTAALRLGSSVAAGARSATWRSVALLVVAAAGWVLHSVTPNGGFWGSIVSEFAITLCVGGLGAVVVTLLPFTGSAGQSLLARSRGRYAGIAVVAVALAAAVYSGEAGTHVSPVALAVVASVCACGAVAVQVWLRGTRSDQRV